MHAPAYALAVRRGDGSGTDAAEFMRTPHWQASTGQERTTVELHADDISFLDRRRPEYHLPNVAAALEP